MEIKQTKTVDLIPYVNNARTHTPEQVNQICSSIKEFGFCNPVLVDNDNGIIAGHGRVLAANKLKLKEIPTVCLGHLSETQKKAYILADNRLALDAGWNDELLSLELSALKDLDFDLSLVGFSDDELLDLMELEDAKDPNVAPDKPAKPVTILDDVWCMDDHRLLCGDSTVKSSYDRLMSGARSDCIWTDPPYNVDYSGSAGKIANDNMEDDAFRIFLRDAFSCAFEFIKKGSAIYVAHADTEGLNFRGAFKEAGYKISGCLIWEKNSLVLGRSDYQWRHEPILYGWKPGAAHRWYGGRKNTTIFNLGGDVVTDNRDGTLTLKIGGTYSVVSGVDVKVREVESSVFTVERPAKSKQHPTMKPVELILKMMRNSTRAGDVVMDMFGGSGSTLIACDMVGRFCRSIELDPGFCDVIVTRWQDYTGKQATHENGKTFEEIKEERG